jgi:hypothetical protein
MMLVAKFGLFKAPSPLSARNCVGPALIRILICAWDSAQPQPSPLSEIFATTRAFPVHISTGTGLVSSRICARTGLAHVLIFATTGRNSRLHLDGHWTDPHPQQD